MRNVNHEGRRNANTALPIKRSFDSCHPWRRRRHRSTSTCSTPGSTTTWDAYRWLRRNAPLWWDARNELWVASRHEDVSHISRHQDLYSAAQGVRPKVAAPMSIISMDDPEHPPAAAGEQGVHAPHGAPARRPHRELSHEIIDDIAERGECDFVTDFAMHVPLIVIAELMGLDPAQRDELYRQSDAMMAGDGHTDPDDPVLVAAAEAGGQFATTCLELIEARRADGTTDDIIGILTHAFDEGALPRRAAAPGPASSATTSSSCS